MKRRILGLMVAALALVGASPLEASQASDKREEVFQAAVAQYEAGHYSEQSPGDHGHSLRRGTGLVTPYRG